MKDYTNETPVFSESIRVTETSDPAHADNINMAPIQIFQNTLCNHDSIEKIKKGMGYQEEYNADNVYQTGDYCQYQGILYKCVQNTTGEWDPACWKQTNAMNEISDINIPEFDDYSDEGAEVPDAREAIANIRSKKGFTGIMSNIKAALMGLVTLGEIRGMLVNNGLCSEAGKFFLDAAYGKNLQDQLTKLNSDFGRLSTFHFSYHHMNLHRCLKLTNVNGTDYPVFLMYGLQSKMILSVFTISEISTTAKTKIMHIGDETGVGITATPHTVYITLAGDYYQFGLISQVMYEYEYLDSNPLAI